MYTENVHTNNKSIQQVVLIYLCIHLHVYMCICVCVCKTIIREGEAINSRVRRGGVKSLWEVVWEGLGGKGKVM